MCIRDSPYSPRKQGAGLASLYNAVNTKAYITVDGSDRTKLELFDDPKSCLLYTSLIYASANYEDTFIGALTKFGDIVHHLVLPISVSVILSIGGLMRYTRTNTLEVLNADYIRTARAKGLSEKKVIYKHAFRNTMIPLATLLAGILPSLFGLSLIHI